jgi:hypothetical protein
MRDDYYKYFLFVEIDSVGKVSWHFLLFVIAFGTIDERQPLAGKVRSINTGVIIKPAAMRRFTDKLSKINL